MANENIKTIFDLRDASSGTSPGDLGFVTRNGRTVKMVASAGAAISASAAVRLSAATNGYTVEQVAATGDVVVGVAEASIAASGTGFITMTDTVAVRFQSGVSVAAGQLVVPGTAGGVVGYVSHASNIVEAVPCGVALASAASDATTTLTVKLINYFG
jgi:hypothetical protein